jgi:hypothetical protein
MKNLASREETSDVNVDVKGTDYSQPALNQETCSRPTPRDVSLPERHLQPLRNRLREEELHVVLDLSWNVVFNILPVRPRKYHLLHTRSVCSQDLFFDPAYGLDTTAEGNLEVDGYVRMREDAGERTSYTTSPVMATSTGTHRPVNNDTRAQTMAMPALGPSYTIRWSALVRSIRSPCRITFFCAPDGK